VIDTLRKLIQDRLDQLLSEAERLRHALAALGPREAAPKPAARAAAPPRPASTRVRRPQAGRPRRRTKPGATKSRVLEALSASEAMTAGEIATATGLARGTVSTTLTRLAKDGEVVKAERGYRLPP
jgi:CRP-like cAMP-binding protein